MFQNDEFWGSDKKQDNLNDQLFGNIPSVTSNSTSLKKKKKKKIKIENTNEKNEEKEEKKDRSQTCSSDAEKKNEETKSKKRLIDSEKSCVNSFSAKKKRKKNQKNKDNDGTLEYQNSDIFGEKNTQSKITKDTKNEPLTFSSSKNKDKFTSTDNQSGGSKHSKSLQKLKNRLEGSHFRWINEQLYTIKSKEAYNMFQAEPHLFDVYHKGFTSQVQSWPENPVDIIIQSIIDRDESLVVADFGCGDAKISRDVPNKVYSFDLVAANENVIACDMRKVPLEDGVIDIAIFCLSLMGTNISDFLLEAHRVLKNSGELKIAEVKSRIDDTTNFINQIEQLGFENLNKDDSNKMFVLMEFKKTKRFTDKKGKINLKPCIYKRR